MLTRDYGYFITKLEGNYFSYLVSTFDMKSKQIVRQEGFLELEDALAYIKDEFNWYNTHKGE